MSITYAERRHALPVQVGTHEVTIATCEPFDIAWVPEIEAHTRKAVRLVLASPLELQRYTTEFYTLARSVRAAIKSGETAATASFEQLVELGRSNKPLDANDQGVVQVVDWLWQYAFDQRASDIHLEPRRDLAAIRFRIDGVMHTVYQLPPGVMSAMTARIKLLGRMDVVEKRRPQDGRIKTRNPQRRRGRDAPVDAAHRVRREDGDAHLRPRHRAEADRRARLRRARRAALGGADGAHARHHPRHRAHRLGQDDDAVRHAQAAGDRRGQRLHDRRPDRDDPAGVQPDPGADRRSTSASPKACAR